MAQGDPRPRHSRHTSRILRTGQLNIQNPDAQRTYDDPEAGDAETIEYIKRVLCIPAAGNVKAADSPRLDELLPPLTSSNQVDIQLYAIIAVILNQFVQSWYNRITPDNEFIGEIVKIIAHCTRGVEQRLRHVNLEELLLDELPALLEKHIEAVTVAQDACFNDRIPDEVRMIYHCIHPNRALTPLPDNAANISEQHNNELAWSQLLVTRILPLVLPPEDLQNPCLHVLVSEIFSQMVVHNAVCGRGSEAWVIWEGITKLIHTTSRTRPTRQGVAGITNPDINKLEQYGLLSSDETKQREDLQADQQVRIEGIVRVLWTTLHFLSLGWMLLRSFSHALMHVSSIPARNNRSSKMRTSDRLSVSALADDARLVSDQSGDLRPVVSLRLWSCISKLTSLEHRMPWMFGFLSLLQWLSLNGPGKLCKANGALDRLMSLEIAKRLSRPDLLPRILLAIRSAVFPDNALAPTRQTPTSAEVAVIKRDCANAIVEAIPQAVRARYFATKDSDLMRQDVESTLDLFADPFINKHLIISAVELLILRLFPELSDDGSEE